MRAGLNAEKSTIWRASQHVSERGADPLGFGSRPTAGTTRPRAASGACRCSIRRASGSAARRTSRRPNWRWLASGWRPTGARQALRRPQGRAKAGAWRRFVRNICKHASGDKAAGTMSANHCDNVVRYLNAFCKYAGALSLEELKRGHVQHWLESHPTWGAVTRRNILTILHAAFNYAGREHGLQNPIKGLKKPPPQPRLASFSPEEEQILYAATDRCFADFLLAAIHTGLRPSVSWPASPRTTWKRLLAGCCGGSVLRRPRRRARSRCGPRRPSWRGA